METKNYQIGPGFFGLLGIAFIVLKLCNVISWSWGWVLIPLYGPILFVIILLIAFLMVILVGVGISSLFKK